MSYFVHRVCQRLRKEHVGAGVRPAGKVSKRLVFEPLEPRLLLSADSSLGIVYPVEAPVREAIPPPVIVASADDGSSQVTVADHPVEKSNSTVRDSVEASTTRREVVFVDIGVAGYEQFVADVSAQQSDSRRIEIHLLDGQRDGIEQITELLAGHTQLDAVHFISHGSEGAVRLGATWLDATSLQAVADSIRRWGAALGENADLLFYGCELAGSASGVSLIEQLSRLTGADVAASTDNTGSALFGGNWNLEYATGSIETNIAANAQTQAGWQGPLATLILGVNQAPVNSVPGVQSTPQDTPLAFSAVNSNLVSISDADAGSEQVQVALTATNGKVTLGWPSGTAAMAGGEFRVNTATSDRQATVDGGFYSGTTNDSGSPRAVASDHSGNYVVTWSSKNQDGNGWGIYAQRYNAAGVAQGGEFRVNTTTNKDQVHSSVAMDEAGNFVIVWSSNDQDGDNWGIYAQRYNAAGVAQGSEFRVNTYTSKEQLAPSIAMDSGGNF
ncbi:MAG: DUF4347 domain-containing protein, partial [Deltaproteobacteria bacterium]|nr:DUF4347 domain-containing protein [Deltaproteobacteria bacterium]